MQDALLGYIFNQIQDGSSYFRLDYNANDELLAINMYSGDLGNHKKIPIVQLMPSNSTVVYKQVKYGPMADWIP